MSNRKLDFKTWCNDMGILECYQTTKCDDCKAAWDFAEAQEKREYELLESEHSELLANFCKVDMERIKLSREINELKIKFSEATKTYTDEIDELEKENEALKKKLSEAVEVIKFYATLDHNDSAYLADDYDNTNFFLNTDDISSEIWTNGKVSHRGNYYGKRARAFLKGDKDE